jgi:hypothetical protein
MTTELLNLLASIHTQKAGLMKLAVEYGVESPEIQEQTDRQIETLSQLVMITQAELETHA